MPCPSCLQAPELTFEDAHFEFNYMIRCLQMNHDHVAGGPTLEIAMKNWNGYVTGVIRVCPEVIRKRNENKTEKIINDAMFEIDPKEGE